jgi:hypothetical protein
MKIENNYTDFSLRLFAEEKEGKTQYKMVEYLNDKIVKVFESEKMIDCLNYFRKNNNPDNWTYNNAEMSQLLN